jgi:hypothetical protein
MAIAVAILAGCWMIRQPAVPPPVTRTPTQIAIPITVRPVTSTPTKISPTNTPTSTPRTPATITQTYTPNPSTLITPSPQVLPATGQTQPLNVVVPLLAGGAILLLIGLLARWTTKPKG